jgi:DNA-binding transcriptional ArsR family regulator
MKNELYLVRQLKALANRRRIKILSFLKKKHNATPSELVRMLRISQQSVSRHLKILMAADIVDYRQRGLVVSYRLRLNQSKEVQVVIGGL